MVFDFNLLSHNRAGQYVLLWSAANNLKTLNPKDVAALDIGQLCDALVTTVSSASPPPFYICADLVHGACIILNRQCSETLQHFENEFHFLNNLDIPQFPEKRMVPLLEAKDVAIRSGILEISEICDSFEETLKDSLEEAVKDTFRESIMDTFKETSKDQPEQPLKDSLKETSLLQVQKLSLPFQKHSTPLRWSTIDEQLDGSSVRHQDLRQMDEIEELAAMEMEFPQEFEILLEEEAMDVDKQELPKKLLVDSSSSDDHSKQQIEQTKRSIITEADVDEEILLENVFQEQGGRRRRKAIIADRVTQICIQRHNPNIEMRCKNFSDDMIAVTPAAHPYMLVNSWILDELLSREPEMREVKNRKTASSLRDLLTRHAEESRTSLQQESILRTDVGSTKNDTLPKISSEEPSVIAAVAPFDLEMLPDPRLLSPNIDLQAVPYAQEPELQGVPHDQEPQLQGVPHDQEPELQGVPHYQEPELQGVPHDQEPELQAMPYEQEPVQQLESRMEIEDGALGVVREEDSYFDEDNALNMLKQRILNLWENLDIVTFEDLCPRDKTGKKEIVRNLHLLGILDFNEFLYLEQASPTDPIIISKF